MQRSQLTELILQSLEHERGGVQIYKTALDAATHDDLRSEWSRYLDQTKRHVQILEGVCRTMELDLEKPSPGRQIVRDLGQALVAAMLAAQQAGDRAAAQLVAAECIVLAETKDHADWELIGKCVASLEGDEQATLAAAFEEVEDQEDEHLYHTKGWARELWLQSLGLPATLPPPEERKHVTTAIGAALAQQDSMANRQ